MKSSHLKSVAILVVLVASVIADDDALWNSSNCPDGDVVDALCCKDKHCLDLNTERACETDITCHWKEKNNGNGKCVSNRDKENNVCCKKSGNEAANWCSDITKGKCPKAFQVRNGCCSTKQAKWNTVLEVRNPNMVCCNTPCHQCGKKVGCARSEHCREKPVPGLNARSFGGQYNPYSYNPSFYGFSDLYLPQSYPFTYGKQYFTGLELPHHSGYGKEHHKPKHDKHKKEEDEDEDDHEDKVEEITVDDVIEALTEALKNDNDVFESSYEINSDPWFGKQTDRGPYGGLKLKDPSYFIDAIYDGKKSHHGYGPYSYAYAAPYGHRYGYPSRGGHHGGSSYGYPSYSSPYQTSGYSSYPSYGGYPATQSYAPTHGGYQ